MQKTYLTTSPSQTKKIGETLAKKVLRTGEAKTKLKKKALIIGLEGDLGGGKTTFLQGFAKGLGIKEKILSPTFIIMRKFQVSGFRFRYFYHIDCYRIQKQKEILDLGFREIISNPQNIITIEWAEKIKKIIPKEVTWVNFEFINKKKRRIFVTSLFA